MLLQVDFSNICGTATATLVSQVDCLRFPPAPSLAFIIIFVFEPILCCHSHCNYDACSGCMQWQNGNVGDPRPQPCQKVIISMLWLLHFSELSQQGGSFFLISTPLLGPSLPICHSKVVFFKMAHHLATATVDVAPSGIFWCTQLFWYFC